jgi:tetratricopeptide (TPR) repeat protein
MAEDKNAKAIALLQSLAARNAGQPAKGTAPAGNRIDAQQQSQPPARETEGFKIPPEGPANAEATPAATSNIPETMVPPAVTIPPIPAPRPPPIVIPDAPSAQPEEIAGVPSAIPSTETAPPISQTQVQGEPKNTGQPLNAGTPTHQTPIQQGTPSHSIPDPFEALVNLYNSVEARLKSWLDSIKGGFVRVRDWCESKKRAITVIAVTMTALATIAPMGRLVAKRYFEARAERAVATAKLEKARKADEAKKARLAVIAENKRKEEAANAERKRKEIEAAKKSEAAIAARAKPIAEAITKRCWAAAAEVCNREARASAVCLDVKDTLERAKLAEAYEIAGEYEQAGKHYLKAGNIPKAKEMLRKCIKAKDSECIGKLGDESRAMSAALVISTRSIKQHPTPASAPATAPAEETKPVCPKEFDAERANAIAGMFESVEDHQNAGLVYLETGKLGKAKDMLNRCESAKNNMCVHELNEASRKIADELAKKRALSGEKGE